MKQISLGSTKEQVSQIILGCSRMNSVGKNPVTAIETAYGNGINYFDHADIYGAGECERIFADSFAKTSIPRNDIFLQSKCGIVPGERLDFSKDYILRAVEGSLKRLKTDYLDALLLHRPDTLVEPEEVAEAFYNLEKSGKVRYFGVSNQKPLQIELLKTAVTQPLIINQLQFGLGHAGMINSGIYVNMNTSGSIDHDDSILEYSRLQQMTIQAWSPFQFGYFEGTFLEHEKFFELNQKLAELANKYQVTKSGIAVCWINTHPAQMQTIIGTMTPSRIEDIAQASDVTLTKAEWYALYQAAGNLLPALRADALNNSI
ncbi:MAG: aldo/keto reductase [Streptococcaceae bacterium]|jgi:predicted oxidoreductase|nr:aldo/keto reductase [Streptococcaceae bacterium]